MSLPSKQRQCSGSLSEEGAIIGAARGERSTHQMPGVLLEATFRKSQRIFVACFSATWNVPNHLKMETVTRQYAFTFDTSLSLCAANHSEFGDDLASKRETLKTRMKIRTCKISLPRCFCMLIVDMASCSLRPFDFMNDSYPQTPLPTSGR